MVRALSRTPFLFGEFLERLRPGILVSAIVHAGLFIGLAYLLAFQPAATVPAEPEDTVVTVLDIPPPTKPVIQQDSKFRPAETPTIKDVISSVKPLVIPADRSFDRQSTTIAPQTVQPPAPNIIVNPKPVFRGGLIYPEVAADRGIPGYVVFSFIIEPDGSVGNAQVIEEVPDGYGFAAAAKKAFAKWRFEPRYVNGQPVAWPAQIRITFQLR